ncbi:hydroxyacid dehydrogenase [Paracoccus sp. 1_MG-2023]|uniref:hydroxyacid dehydrogenase n=1 Tax=unclassified Paracoccus (in: a-proteobacteria) TaxID=2688777 RepID=UPI001C07F9F3|nr:MULTISPECIES: hydroxyacid dehydrogenase [unclassified Paracoccus (in: a-proteobacteria)]MBU2957888.1 hydroxyacid dehydrogenase [Paracoccus sp. C2R09]MDO6668919.1 hydroxyacid dehydrogenase [Paracoccus sp. 1_MG-2023]
MSRIVISEFMDEDAVVRLTGATSTAYQPDLVDRPDDLRRTIASAEVLIVRNRTRVDAALLDAAPGLRAVGRLGVGLDNIDLPACKERGITVWPATGANDLAVCEYVITTAMMLLRGAYLASDRVAAGEWPRQSLIGREMSGRVMGLLGFGSIARQVAGCARALGMQVIAHDPHLPAGDPAWAAATSVGFEQLMEGADVLSLHVPLTSQTWHVIDRAALARMQPRAVLINAARGGVVDEDALASALREGRLAGAALDVFETEPLQAEAGSRLAGIDNVILTPHVAGVTEESNVRVSNLIADKVLAHLKERV